MNLKQSWDWFGLLVRSAGASFPGASSLAHFQGELDMQAIDERLKRFEDPISQLHEDIPEISKRIYDAVKTADGNLLDLEMSTYSECKRSLAILESNGLIRGHHAIGERYACGISIPNTEYLLYLASHFEDATKMKQLLDAVESLSDGKSTRTNELAENHCIPCLVVNAVLQSFVDKGFGRMSKRNSNNQTYSGV